MHQKATFIQRTPIPKSRRTKTKPKTPHNNSKNWKNLGGKKELLGTYLGSTIKNDGLIGNARQKCVFDNDHKWKRMGYSQTKIFIVVHDKGTCITLKISCVLGSWCI